MTKNDRVILREPQLGMGFEVHPGQKPINNTSMEIDYNKVEGCDSGLEGIKVNGKVRTKDKVYKIRKIDNNSFLFGYVYGY